MAGRRGGQPQAGRRGASVSSVSAPALRRPPSAQPAWPRWVLVRWDHAARCRGSIADARGLAPAGPGVPSGAEPSGGILFSATPLAATPTGADPHRCRPPPPAAPTGGRRTGAASGEHVPTSVAPAASPLTAMNVPGACGAAVKRRRCPRGGLPAEQAGPPGRPSGGGATGTAPPGWRPRAAIRAPLDDGRPRRRPFGGNPPRRRRPARSTATDLRPRCGTAAFPRRRPRRATRWHPVRRFARGVPGPPAGCPPRAPAIHSSHDARSARPRAHSVARMALPVLPAPTTGADAPGPPDLRLVPSALAVWAVVLLGIGLGPVAGAGALVGCLLLVGFAVVRRGPPWVLAAGGCAAAAALVVTAHALLA